MEPKDYIERVDRMYQHCKQRKLSRHSPDWDAFSVEINRQRRAVEAGSAGPRKRIWQMCLAYWFEVSELLEMIHTGRSRTGTRIKAQKKHKALMKLKKKILAGKVDAAVCTSGLIQLMADAQKRHGAPSHGDLVA